MYLSNSWAPSYNKWFMLDDVFVVVEVAEKFFGIVVDIVRLFQQAWAQEII